MALISIWSVLVALIAVFLYIYLKKKFSYFKDRKMHYTSPTVVDFFKCLSITSLSDLPKKIYNKEMNGSHPYVGYFVLFKPWILVVDPQLAEKVLIKDFSHFQDHGFDVDIETNPLLGHLFSMKGDEWRTLRHKLVPTFTSGKLKGMVPIMEECADDLIKEINGDPSLQNETNFKDLSKKYSLAVIARCAFGINPDGVKDPKSEFSRIMKKLITPTIPSLIKLGLLIAFPFITKIFKIKLFPKDIEDFFFNFMRESFEARKRSGIKTNDFVQLLLELKEKGRVEVDTKELEQDEKESMENIKLESTPANLEFTEKLLMAQVFVFVVAGFENTAYLVAITLYVLSKHPEIQERARSEVVDARMKHGAMNYQALREMTLLQACTDEALRLYSPVPTLMRECNKPYTLSDGTKIEKGSTMAFPVLSLHLDARYWPNPEQFDPNRFLNKNNIQPGTYLPFGDGPRICIAQRMALLVCKIMVAKMLENYQILPSSKTKEPLNITFVGSSDAEGGLWGSFRSLK